MSFAHFRQILKVFLEDTGKRLTFGAGCAIMRMSEVSNVPLETMRECLDFGLKTCALVPVQVNQDPERN